LLAPWFARLGRAAALVVFASAASAEALTLDVPTPPPAAVDEPIQFVATVGEAVGEVTYDWNFGDGTELTGQAAQVTHQYSVPGHYPVIVKATDESSFRTRGLMLTVHLPLPATPPSSSSPLALDPERRRVWCVNPDNDTVSAFDASTREKLFEVPVGPHPRTIARGPDDTFWVVNQDDHSLSVLAGSDGSTLGTIGLDYASRPFGIVIHGSTAYVSLEGSSAVLRVDTVARQITGRVGVGAKIRALSISSDGGTLFAARLISPETSGEIYRIDTAGEMSHLGTHTLGIDEHPDAESNGRGLPNYLTGVALSPDEQSLFIPSKKDNVLRGAGRDGLALNHENTVRTILSRIAVTGGVEDAGFRVDFNDRDSASAVAFTPLGDTAFVALQGSNRVEIVDAYSGAVLGGILDAGRAPQGLVVFENVLIVHEFMSRELAFFDVTTILDGTDYSATLLGRTAAVASEKLSPEVLRGKQIFYDASDTRMSRDGYISCASCHLDGFEDGRVWDFTDRGEGFRNTTSLLGRRGTGHGPVHWTANFDEIQDFEHDIRNAFGGTGLLSDEDFATGTRNTTLGDPKAGLSEELDALAAYVTSLDRVHPSPHRNPDGTLTEAGVRGRALFETLDCSRCHAGEDFTDSSSGTRHDVGTIGPQSGQRLGGELDGLDTPTLLGIWETAPYLHDGSAATLRDVFSREGAELHAGRELSPAELDDLTAYLQQIDGLPDVGPEPTGGAGGMAGAGGESGSAGAAGQTMVGGAGGSAGAAGTNASVEGGMAGAGTAGEATVAGAGGSTAPGARAPRKSSGCQLGGTTEGSALGLLLIASLFLRLCGERGFAARRRCAGRER
jgi:DNA-binding beta-propeller fold protein YncE